MYFQKFPLVRLVIVFALGIVSSHYSSAQLSFPSWIFFLLFGALILVNRLYSIKLNLIYGVLALALFFELGVYRLEQKVKADDPIQLKNVSLEQVIAYQAHVQDRPQEKENSYQLNLNVYELIYPDQSLKVEGKVILYTDTITGSLLKSGDLIWVQAPPQQTEKPSNPFEFDYQEYLGFKNIHFQHYERDIRKVGHFQRLWIPSTAEHLRLKATDIFQQHIPSAQIRAIALALVLGQKDELDSEISNAYAASGAMHVLAVSGLHVGLIYLLFSFGFKRLPFCIRKLLWLETSLAILILLIYAWLTGLSPSVMRAVTMFSFMAIGKGTGRNSNIYNSLAASALVLLLVDPHLIMSVGFQLSYLAVIGIVYLQPKLYKLFEFKHWLVDKAWAITCVSFAAQLATAPLSILYFHQFPSYFFVANLFVIPAAFLILLTGITLLAFSFSDILADWVGQILSFFISTTNQLVTGVSNLPNGQITGIQLSVIETWLIYGVIVCLLLTLVEKKVRSIYFALGLSLIFCTSQIWQRSKSLNSSELVVFDVTQEQAVSFRSGDQQKLIASHQLLSDLDKLTFHIYPYRLYHHAIQNPSNDQLGIAQKQLKGGTMIVFEGQKILILSNDFDVNKLPPDVKWDLCVSEQAEHISVVKADEFVLTSNRFREQLQEDIQVHLVPKEGFYFKQL